MAGTFWALVPPIVAIVLALITKETYTSLFFGIVVGALFVGGFKRLTKESCSWCGRPGLCTDAGFFC